jgi:hypothetical protein
MSPMSEEEIMMVTYVWGGNHDGHLCLRRKSWCQLCLRRKSWWSHMSEGGNHDGHIGLREEIMMSPMSEGRNHNGHLCLREENISLIIKCVASDYPFGIFKVFFCFTLRPMKMPTWFSHHIMFVWFNSKTMGITSGVWSAWFFWPYEFAPGFLMLLHLCFFVLHFSSFFYIIVCPLSFFGHCIVWHSSIYEEQTTQWPKEKGQTTIYKTYT